MIHVGELYENPVTGERVVVRVPPRQSNGHLLVVDLYLRPGGSVAGAEEARVVVEVQPGERWAQLIRPASLRRELPTVDLEPLPAETAELIPSLSTRTRWPNSTTATAVH